MYGDWSETDQHEAENEHSKATLGHRIAADKNKELEDAKEVIKALREELAKEKTTKPIKPLSGMQLFGLAAKRQWCDVEFGRAVMEEFCRFNGIILACNENDAVYPAQQEATESCAHRFVRDEEAPRHLCCQVCGEVKNEADEAGGA